LSAVQSLLLPFIKAADDAAPERAAGAHAALQPSVLVDAQTPKALVEKMAFSLPDSQGMGRDGLLDTIQKLLKYSVNTWDQGFLDKLYASTNAVSRIHHSISKSWSN
jgi:glutamate decarboxylase